MRLSASLLLPVLIQGPFPPGEPGERGGRWRSRRRLTSYDVELQFAVAGTSTHTNDAGNSEFNPLRVGPAAGYSFVKTTQKNLENNIKREHVITSPANASDVSFVSQGRREKRERERRRVWGRDTPLLLTPEAAPPLL